MVVSRTWHYGRVSRYPIREDFWHGFLSFYSAEYATLIVSRTNVLGEYYGLVIVTLPRPQTFRRQRDNLKNLDPVW